MAKGQLSIPKNTTANCMYEISPSNGFGPIKFGFTPSEVKSVWGSELVYEDWMGGNLENFSFSEGC